MCMENVIIIGAGYAGIMAANRLAPTHRVSVLAPREVFVDRIRLHELIAGSRRSATVPLRQMLDARVAVRRGEATRVEPGLVETAEGERLAARHIVLAVGSGAAGGATDLEGALALRDQVAALADGARIRVVGGGFTGLELAAELADAGPARSVRLASRGGRLGPEGHGDAVAASLERLGVELGADPGSSDDVALEMRATGFRVPDLAARSGLPVAEDGRVLVDDALRVVGAEGIWAAGDCAAIEGRAPLRMSCAAAEPLGAHAADGIRRADEGSPAEPLDLGFAAQCVSLGRRDGIVAFVHPDDSATGRSLRGRSGALAKELVCRMAAWAPRRIARVYRWPGAGRQTSVA